MSKSVIILQKDKRDITQKYPYWDDQTEYKFYLITHLKQSQKWMFIVYEY